MSTQSQGGGPPLRGYRRRKTMLDLNVPPIEGRDQEGPSALDVLQGVQANRQGQPVPSGTIDVETIDDDVVVSSPRAFAEAKNNAQQSLNQRTPGNTVAVDVDSGRTIRLTYNIPYKRRRVASNRTIINCEHYVNLESSSSSATNNIQKVQPPLPPPPPPPPPPKVPTFNCPICMSPFVEETSTKCGHIFCKACIKAAMKVQSKCPTCRKRVTIKELIRVFLPPTSSS